jgi:hypothetical protein
MKWPLHSNLRKQRRLLAVRRSLTRRQSDDFACGSRSIGLSIAIKIRNEVTFQLKSVMKTPKLIGEKPFINHAAVCPVTALYQRDPFAIAIEIGRRGNFPIGIGE